MDVEPELSEVPLGVSIVAAKGSLPVHWPSTFQNLIGMRNRVKLKMKPSVDDIYRELVDGKFVDVDLVTLGDAWLTSAIQSGKITPFEFPETYRYRSLLQCSQSHFLTVGGSGSCHIDGIDL